MASINGNVGLVILAGVSNAGEKALAPSGTINDAGEKNRDYGYWRGNYYKEIKSKFSEAGGRFLPLEGSGVYGGSPVVNIPGSGTASEGDDCSAKEGSWQWTGSSCSGGTCMGSETTKTDCTACGGTWSGSWRELTSECQAAAGCDTVAPTSDGEDDSDTDAGTCVGSSTTIQYTATGGHAQWYEGGALRCEVGRDAIPARALYISKDAHLNLGSGVNLCGDYTAYAKILPSGEPTNSIFMSQHKEDPANIIMGCDYDGRYYIRSDQSVSGVNTARYARTLNRFDSYRFPTHVIGKYDEGQLRIYVNGSLEGSSGSFSRDTSSCAHTEVMVGKKQRPFLEQGFRGWFDELAVMGSGLKDKDIKNFYNSIYRLGNFVEELGAPTGGAFDGQAFGGSDDFWPTTETGTGAFDALDTEYIEFSVESGVDGTKAKGGAFALYNYNKASGDCGSLVRTPTKNAVSSVLSFDLVNPPTNFFQLTGLTVEAWVENSTNHPSGADIYASITNKTATVASGLNVNWAGGYKYVPSGGKTKLTFSADMPDVIYGKDGVSFFNAFANHKLNFTVVYPKADFPYDGEFKIYSTRVKYSSFETFNSLSLNGPNLFTRGTSVTAINSDMRLFLDADVAAASMNLFVKKTSDSSLGDTGHGFVTAGASVITNRTMNLFTKGGMDATAMNLYAKVDNFTPVRITTDLYTLGATVSQPFLSNTRDLFILGPPGRGTPSGTMILAMPNVGIGTINNRRLLYTEGTKPTATLNLFAQQSTTAINKSIKLFIDSPIRQNASGIMNLYLNQRDLAGIGSVAGLPAITTNDNMNLFTTGLVRPSGTMNLSIPNTIASPSGILNIIITGA